MDADGSDQFNLGVIGDAYSRPTWSPDGTRVAYSWLTACVVPNVVGKLLQDARFRLDRASCSAGRIRFKRSARPRGTVLSQKPRGRAERRIGTKVALVASRGG
jgi:beta-lactam-binding protein with PASTA domain